MCIHKLSGVCIFKTYTLQPSEREKKRKGVFTFLIVIFSAI